MKSRHKIRALLERNKQNVVVTRDTEWATQEAYNWLSDSYDYWAELWQQANADMNTFASLVEDDVYSQLDESITNNDFIKSMASANLQEIDFRRLAERLAEVAQGL